MVNEEPKNSEVKRHKIRRSDWQKVEQYLKRELETRKGNEFRKSHMKRWREIDRHESPEWPTQRPRPLPVFLRNRG